MPEDNASVHSHLLAIGLLVLAGVLVKVVFRRCLKTPPVVGYIALGLGLRMMHGRQLETSVVGEWSLSLLSEIGIACLLFHVGLKSDVRTLQAQLPRAVGVWVSNVLFATLLGYLGTLALGFDHVPALFVGAAFSATSVGITISVWTDLGRMRSKLGALLLDVAELDDLSAIILMLATVAAAPALAGQTSGQNPALLALSATVFVVAKMALFGLGCILFARYLEEPMTRALSRAQLPSERVLTLVGFSFGMAAIAGELGFSAAVGALFAGLMFSRDPRAVHQDASFSPIYELFTPFFFIDIGFSLSPDVMADSIWLGVILFLPAAAGKVLGGAAPLVRGYGPAAAFIFGVSLIPRAEIALLIVHTGNHLGPWAVPDRLYGAAVVACGLSSTFAPLVLDRLLVRFPNVARSRD